MTAVEIEQARKKEEADNYITTVKGGVKKIEVLGMEKAYEWRSDVNTIRDVALDRMKISSLGAKDTIKNCIPGCMILYLDKNLLYNWDQYFEIIKQLGFLRSFILTGNKFKRISREYLDNKNLA